MAIQRILPSERRWPLHGTRRTRELEALAIAATDPHATPGVLMRRAGLAVARLALAVAPHARGFGVEAGPGNNGGDGLEAALNLHRWGRRAWVHLHGDPARLPADAAAALARAREAGVPVHVGANPPAGWSMSAGNAVMAIDALLGLGARRAPEGALGAAVERLNAAGGPVLSIDLPSGLHGDTGQALGGHAVRADHTLALLTLKPGLFTAQGRDHAGTVWFDDLATDPPADPPDAWLHRPATWPPTSRQHAQHKGSFGDVVVVGGDTGMLGAAMLAARAAQAAGAGRIWLAVLGPDSPGIDVLRPELMWRRGLAGFSDAALQGATVACGCGGGSAVQGALPRVLALAPRLVLDADALNAVATASALATTLAARAASGLATVLTPHPLEAARLLACSTQAVQANRVDTALRLAQRFQCVVVLKGSGTVTAAPGRPPSINPTGDASLATGGTGDVLAGFIAGLWGSRSGPAKTAAATSASPAAIDIALATACDAVWAHGRAAQALGLAAVEPGALVDRLHHDLAPSTALGRLR